MTGVEPEKADDATRSFRTRVLHTVTNPDTIADGARTPSLGKLTFPLVLQYVDDMVTVSDDAIVSATLFLWNRLKTDIFEFRDTESWSSSHGQKHGSVWKQLDPILSRSDLCSTYYLLLKSSTLKSQ